MQRIHLWPIRNPNHERGGQCQYPDLHGAGGRWHGTDVLRARYYHPGLARFISEDPISLAGGINIYLYVVGNPISYRDPLGLKIWHDGGSSWTDTPTGPGWKKWTGWDGGKGRPASSSSSNSPAATCIQDY
ncbi:MAG: RHS repeat-associated core domain-containing protein [Betaproteobacteria bacterium]|nr:RHS repeat-associated core domain-containing protein [Betaproteobacteria bacterium]